MSLRVYRDYIGVILEVMQQEQIQHRQEGENKKGRAETDKIEQILQQNREFF